MYTGSRLQLQRLKRCKRSCSLQVFLVTYLSNIVVNDFDAKKFSRKSRMLVVSGTQ